MIAKKKGKFRKKVWGRTRAAARDLINYVKELLEQDEFPKAVIPGSDYECGQNFLEDTLEWGESVDNLIVAERLFHAMYALGLETNHRPIRNWQRAYAQYKKYFTKKISVSQDS